MRNQQTRVCHAPAFLVHGDDVSRNADMARCHCVRYFLGGVLIRRLPHFARNNAATAVFELYDNDFFASDIFLALSFVL